MGVGMSGVSMFLQVTPNYQWFIQRHLYRRKNLYTEPQNSLDVCLFG